MLVFSRLDRERRGRVLQLFLTPGDACASRDETSQCFEIVDVPDRDHLRNAAVAGDPDLRKSGRLDHRRSAQETVIDEARLTPDRDVGSKTFVVKQLTPVYSSAAPAMLRPASRPVISALSQ